LRWWRPDEGRQLSFWRNDRDECKSAKTNPLNPAKSRHCSIDERDKPSEDWNVQKQTHFGIIISITYNEYL
jgi:hypothetical protein